MGFFVSDLNTPVLTFPSEQV